MVTHKKLFIFLGTHIRTLLYLELRHKLFLTMNSNRFGHVAKAVEYTVLSSEWATAVLHVMAWNPLVNSY